MKLSIFFILLSLKSFSQTVEQRLNTLSYQVSVLRAADSTQKIKENYQTGLINTLQSQVTILTKRLYYYSSDSAVKTKQLVSLQNKVDAIPLIAVTFVPPLYATYNTNKTKVTIRYTPSIISKAQTKKILK